MAENADELVKEIIKNEFRQTSAKRRESCSTLAAPFGASSCDNILCVTLLLTNSLLSPLRQQSQNQEI